MPRAKRPLSEADPNASTRSSRTRSKAPKLQEKQSGGPDQQETEQKSNEKQKDSSPEKEENNENANDSPVQPKISTSRHKSLQVYEEHPIDASIAERFEDRSYMMRIIKTYNDLHIPELKELLAERALRISGKKSDLVSRLVQWDDQHPSGEKKVGDDHKEALARQPVPIGANASEMGPKKEDPVTAIQRRGPEGPPVYDELGFELDYKKCTGGPTTKDAMVRNMDR
ncbi:hypothetical protein BCR34DRAFT_343874 [Clohesyomyces aquaticus]|uniref:SAP domain-containing protein n=1 Tax=Clohesyomyces aquaticus TaxID=1231657 RepID=A0A1Y1ZL93_9PLEO|nr:hypothetical protein BCR34DRAFT_343874 [Clohesyomyces aquaticus]